METSSMHRRPPSAGSSPRSVSLPPSPENGVNTSFVNSTEAPLQLSESFKVPPIQFSTVAMQLHNRIKKADELTPPRPPCPVRANHMVLLCKSVMFPTYCPLPDASWVAGEVIDCQDPKRFHVPSVHQLSTLLQEISTYLEEECLSAVKLTHWDAYHHPGDRDTHCQCPRHGKAYGGNCVAIDRKVPPNEVNEQSIREEIVSKIVVPLVESLPEIAVVLETDIEATLKKDVVVNHRSEVLINYPGIKCLTYQRIAHRLHDLGAPLLLSRLITERAHSETGIDIHPATIIGHSCFIDHGTGIVIGATAEIGNGVSFYQGATLGAKSFKRDANGERIKHLPRHPMVEDNVILYAHCSVLGRVRIGKGAVIGGNVWVTSDVAAGSIVLQPQNKIEQAFMDGAGI